MSFDDRARRAVADLAAKAAVADMPPPPDLHHRRRFHPVAAFAAGAVAVIALVLVPLMLSGGPRRAEDPAVTIPSTVPTTEPPPTTVVPTTAPPDDATPSSTVPPSTPVITTVTIDDLTALVPPAAAPSVVAEFEWGDGQNQIGRNEKGVGPCCFDVASDGTIVILDSANLRLVAIGPRDEGARTIAQWEAGDFVPDAMVISGEPRDDVIFVLGITTRTNGPHDLITMHLDGTVIERAETTVESNVEMVESAGAVWATSRRTGGIGWIALATTVGDIADLENQRIDDGLFLSDRGVLETEAGPQRTGVILTRTDVNDNGIQYEIDFDRETWGHFAIPLGDRILVTAWTTGIDLDGSVGRVAAVLDLAGNVVDGFTWQGSSWAEVGPFGLTRFGPDGAIYEMYSTEASVAIRRSPLAQAGGFDDLIARAGFGRAMTTTMTTFERTLWIAGPLRTDSDREWAEILEVDLRSRELVAVHEVPSAMNAIDVVGKKLWMAVAGDGALPANLVGLLNASTGELKLADLADISPVDLVATQNGAWLLDGGGSSRVVFVAERGLEIETSVELPRGSSPQAMDLVGDTLWIATFEGVVLRFDTAAGEFLEPIDVSLAAIDIVAVEDVSDRGGFSVWVAGQSGGLRHLGSDGSIESADSLAGRRITLTTALTSGSVWAATDDGDVYFATPGGPPVLSVETGVAGVNAMAFDGRLWVLGDTLQFVQFGQ